MSEVMIILHMIMLILFIIYLFNNNRAMNSKSVVIDKENKKEMEKLLKMKRIKLTEPLTETNFFQNINTEKFTKQYREFTHTQESFQVLTACRTFSLKQTKICITTHLHSARTENAVKII